MKLSPGRQRDRMSLRGLKIELSIFDKKKNNKQTLLFYLVGQLAFCPPLALFSISF